MNLNIPLESRDVHIIRTALYTMICAYNEILSNAETMTLISAEHADAPAVMRGVVTRCEQLFRQLPRIDGVCKACGMLADGCEIEKCPSQAAEIVDNLLANLKFDAE